MAQEGYRNIPIKKEMGDKAERLIKRRRELGYRSLTEFVNDCVRRRIEEIEKNEL